MKTLDLLILYNLRRTIRSKWAELGIQRVVAELMLNHTPDILIHTFNQCNYSKEKRTTNDLWDNALGRLVDRRASNREL